MLLQQFLEGIVWLAVVFAQAQDYEGLLFGHESAFDSESLFGDLLSALVCVFLAWGLLPLFHDERAYFLVPLVDSQGTDHGNFSGLFGRLGLKLDFLRNGQIQNSCILGAKVKFLLLYTSFTICCRKLTWLRCPTLLALLADPYLFGASRMLILCLICLLDCFRIWLDNRLQTVAFFWNWSFHVSCLNYWCLYAFNHWNCLSYFLNVHWKTYVLRLQHQTVHLRYLQHHRKKVLAHSGERILPRTYIWADENGRWFPARNKLILLFW